MPKDKPILEKTFNEGLDIEQKLREGGVLGTLYMEVQGTDKELAKKALETTIFERMGAEPHSYLLEVKQYDIKKDDKGDHYSGVVETKVMADDFRWFVSLVMRYGPSAIEIIEPEEVHLSLDEMTSLLADVSEMTQMLSSKILTLLKDDERRELYNKMFEGGVG